MKFSSNFFAVIFNNKTIGSLSSATQYFFSLLSNYDNLVPLPPPKKKEWKKVVCPGGGGWLKGKFFFLLALKTNFQAKKQIFAWIITRHLLLINEQERILPIWQTTPAPEGTSVTRRFIFSPAKICNLVLNCGTVAHRRPQFIIVLHNFIIGFHNFSSGYAILVPD